MGYYIDKQNNTKLKREGDKSFIKIQGKETKISSKSNAVVDIMLLNKPISKQQYEK